MNKVTVFAIGVVMTACEPASQFQYDCGDGCFSVDDLRLGSPDLLVRAPGIWHFFDEYGATIPPYCEVDARTGSGSLTPLWERTIIASGDERLHSSARTEGGTAALDVHGDTLALSYGEELWILDARTGAPRHIVQRVGKEEDPWSRDINAPGTAVLVHDGHWLWVNAIGPALVDLRSFDVGRGFSLSVGTPYEIPSWHGISPAVSLDGTLFWLDHTGTLRALQTDGVTRWEVTGKAGVPLMADDLVLLRHGPPQALDALTGELRWSVPNTGGLDEILLADDAKVGALIPVRHSGANSRPYVAMRRVSDGVSVQTLTPSADAGFDFFPSQGALSDDGVLYLSSPFAKRVVAIELDTGREKWVRPDELQTPPVIGDNGLVYLATSDCAISVIGGDGQRIAHFVTQGRPTPHLMKLRGGILYVLTELPGMGGDPNNVEDWLYPGSARAPLVDGQRRRPKDYGCSAELSCFLLKPGQGSFAKLYAFRVE